MLRRGPVILLFKNGNAFARYLGNSKQLDIRTYIETGMKNQDIYGKRKNIIYVSLSGAAARTGKLKEKRKKKII